MVRLEVIPDASRGIVVLQITELPAKPLAHIELTPGGVQGALAGLLSAWVHMGAGSTAPGEIGTLAAMPTIGDPAWRLGVNPLDGAVVLCFRAPVQGPHELWLNYALPPAEAEKLRTLLNEKARPRHEGTA